MSRTVEVLLRSADSSGELSVTSFVLPRRSAGPPLHVHPAHGEGFYVLEGEITLRVGDQVRTAGPGTLVFAAKGVAHTFANRGDREARMLVLCAPAGFESYFDRLAEDRDARPNPADAIAVGPSL